MPFCPENRASRGRIAPKRPQSPGNRMHRKFLWSLRYLQVLSSRASYNQHSGVEVFGKMGRGGAPFKRLVLKLHNRTAARPIVRHPREAGASVRFFFPSQKRTARDAVKQGPSQSLQRGKTGIPQRMTMRECFFHPSNARRSRPGSVCKTELHARLHKKARRNVHCPVSPRQKAHQNQCPSDAPFQADVGDLVLATALLKLTGLTGAV